jgi:hypothetical protein
MQVSQVADTVTHAVIGKAKTQDFGINADAAMMNILSNALYSHKNLAVVREVLCNAWDEHIKADITDRPVEVTIAQGKMTIRDFGGGIHPDMMHPIYAVYGASTKKNDGSVTGGFGLGSKAPFAKVDHFEVTSWHQGTKTVYAISKSSAEIEGKPGITSLVSVPCPANETGLAVSLAIGEFETQTFMGLVRDVAMMGEMNVSLNGQPTLKLPFSQAPHDFLMVSGLVLNGVVGWVNNQIFIRYGNVAYPLSEHVAIRNEYRSALNVIERMGGRNGTSAYKLVLQAKPDTIAVTPSRESLSMTDTTVASVKELLQNFLAIAADQNTRLAHVKELHQKLIDQAGKTNPVLLVQSFSSLPRTDGDKLLNRPGVVVNAKGISEAETATSYPDFKGFHQHDLDARLRKLEEISFGGTRNRGRLQTYRKELADHHENRTHGRHSPWFQQRVVQPLIKAMEGKKTLRADKLMVYGSHRWREGERRQHYDWGSTAIVEARKLSGRTLHDYRYFLRNILVLCHSRNDLIERLPYLPVLKEQHGNHPKDVLTYMVSRHTDRVIEAREFFEAQGMVVLDLTKAWAHEEKEVVKPKPKPVVVKPRKKGLVRLDTILGTHGISYKLASDLIETAHRIEEPEFVVQFNPKADSANLHQHLGTSLKRRFVELYGKKGGVTTNSNQFSRFTEELKVPSLRDWLNAKIEVAMESNAAFQSGLSFIPEQNKNIQILNDAQQNLYQIIVRNPDLAIEFGVLNEMTQEDLFLLEAYEQMFEGHRSYRYEAIKDRLRKAARAIPVTQESKELADRIANCRLACIIDTKELGKLFSVEEGQTSRKDAKLSKKLIAARKSALDILVYALEA